MSQNHRRLLACLTLAGLALFSIGCPRKEASIPLSDEESDTTSPGGGSDSEPLDVVVKINRFDVIDWAPAATDVGTGSEDDVAVYAESAAAEGDAVEELAEGEEPEQGPRTATILLELLVRFEGPGEAPEGVDVDIVHSDPSAREKGRHREWLVTHEMRPGEERKDHLELKIPDYAAGDALSVELPISIPMEARD